MTGYEDRYGVLVGIDGSPPSSAALDWAIAEAQARHSLLTICSVIHVLPQWDPYMMWLPREETIRDLRSRAGVLVDQAAARAALRAPDLAVRTALGDGPPATELLRLADRADVVVLGNRGHGGFASLLLGSVSQQVATHAPVPVVVTRPTTGTGPFPGHVVVGVDGSEAGEAALDFAFATADRRGLNLAAVHMQLLTPIDNYVDDQTLQPHFEDDVPGQDLLAAAVEPWARKYPDVRVKRAVHHGSIADGLRRAAGGAALLVIGRRGRDGFRGLLLGSTSQALLPHAPCPVAVLAAPHPQS